jgi:phosphoenolpyruvate carboxykinase (GTP)
MSDLTDWVEDVSRLTYPARVQWCDGTDEEFFRLTDRMVEAGSLFPLNAQHHPGCFLARSDIHDVARSELQTFICTPHPDDAGPTNNWADPVKARHQLREFFRECMRGRTMYVVPYLMGPPGSPHARVGVEITDSPYVVASMRIMTRMGRAALDELRRQGRYVRGLHSTGLLDPEERRICHFPQDDLILSYSSNYGGNALLGKKCFALRLASALGRKEGWLAEHMLILGITSPDGAKTFVAAAFPSACGKTNLAMLVPPERFARDGWKIETVGDDIAWMRFGPDGRLYAINPEAGFFGVAPGTSERTNPHAMATIRANTIFTNVALCPDGTVWWEGKTRVPPERAIDWMGNLWTPVQATPAAHPNSRFTAPARQCPCISPDWEKPDGVPIDALVFGGRRSTVMPLVYQAFDWQHGTFVGATMSSEKTAAATGPTGVLRQDPMAMLPFCGYNMADYWQHWLEMGARPGARMPAVFHVNWFRKDAAGSFLWPGFGDNLRVLQWIVDRARGRGGAEETPIGFVPRESDLDWDGLDLPAETRRELLRIDRDEWRKELLDRQKFFRQFGERLPPEIQAEQERLRQRLGS